MTHWHFDWQNNFPETNREVILYDDLKITKHRADIRLDDGFVVEIQNSFIAVEEVRQREDFYGKSGMCWILNGKSLATNSTINYVFRKKEVGIEIQLPEAGLSVNQFYLDDCDIDDIRSSFFESEVFAHIKKHKFFLDFDVQNGYYIQINFKDKVEKLADYVMKINYTLENILKSKFDDFTAFSLRDKIKISNCNNDRDEYIIILLKKKYWRMFIDKMQVPVYIDNLNGLPSSLLYCCSQNIIISKKEFINNLLHYHCLPLTNNNVLQSSLW